MASVVVSLRKCQASQSEYHQRTETDGVEGYHAEEVLLCALFLGHIDVRIVGGVSAAVAMMTIAVTAPTVLAEAVTFSSTCPEERNKK